jgi:energy-coupling factor transporter ATP-binding protein EcfA2
MDIEKHNTQETMRLNQRGGRTLSIVDLCRAGTLTPEMASFCWMHLESGASLLTGAVPGGAGKTTLMAALLGFLPPEERIATVADRSVIDRAQAGELPRPATLLAHEIGSGRWFGYIWGRDAADFFRCAGPDAPPGLRCVTCLHSDDPEQTRGILLPLGVREPDLEAIGLQLYIHRGLRHGRRLHRVTALHCRLGGELRQVTAWNRTADRHEFMLPLDQIAETTAADTGDDPARVRRDWDRRRDLLTELEAAGTDDWRHVRRAVLEAPST